MNEIKTQETFLSTKDLANKLEDTEEILNIFTILRKYFWENGTSLSDTILESELDYIVDDYICDENQLINKSKIISKALKVITKFLIQNYNIIDNKNNFYDSFVTNTSSPKYRGTKGFVYIGYDKQKRYKIGSTKDLQQREKTFITGNLDYKMLMSCYVNDFRKAEQYLHNYFKDKQIKNEWFNLTQEDLKLLINNGFCLFIE